MRPVGRRTAALVGLLGIITLSMGASTPLLAQSARSDVDLTTKEVGSKETVLGDLIADAIHTAAKSDAAFIAADYFNENVTVPKGSVANSDILRALVMPGDSISIVKLTGDQIQRGLERSLFLYPKFNSGFLQVSGLVVTFRPEADVERRVISIKINGDPLDLSKVYHVAMPTPLAKGGLAYFKIWKPTDILKETDKTLQSALNSYLADHKAITKGEERLIVKTK